MISFDGEPGQDGFALTTQVPTPETYLFLP